MLKKYARGRMADIGCGEKPYREMAAPFVTEHVGIDHESSLHDRAEVDIVGSAYKIPIASEYFDTIICTDVLEHLEEPSDAIAEAKRILKRGGFAIYTVPFFWHLHEEPRDFYRYSKYGLKHLFEKNGFEILELKALSGFFVTFGQELCYFLVQFRGRSKFNPLWWIILLSVTCIQLLAYFLGKFEKNEDFTVEYIIVVKKR